VARPQVWSEIERAPERLKVVPREGGCPVKKPEH
jgi:hypothetical protein